MSEENCMEKTGFYVFFEKIIIINILILMWQGLDSKLEEIVRFL